MRTWKWLPVLVLACGAKKKAPEPVAPPLGWHQEAGASGSCYYPPDFGAMGIGARRMARDETLQAMLGQWRGERGDGIKLDDVVIENIETSLLGTPEKIEMAAKENLDQCRKAMKSGRFDDWKAWSVALPGRLMEGVCRKPLDDTMFYYLDITTGWQFAASICEDDVVEITGTEDDKYRIVEKGPWINVEGDLNGRAVGSEYPCNFEGCRPGQLIMRFTGDSGATFIKPVGLSLVFDPPENGKIEVMINDTSYFNNEFFVESGLMHHTGVTYKPVD